MGLGLFGWFLLGRTLQWKWDFHQFLIPSRQLQSFSDCIQQLWSPFSGSKASTVGSGDAARGCRALHARALSTTEQGAAGPENKTQKEKEHQNNAVCFLSIICFAILEIDTHESAPIIASADESGLFN